MVTENDRANYRFANFMVVEGGIAYGIMRILQSFIQVGISPGEFNSNLSNGVIIISVVSFIFLVSYIFFKDSVYMPVSVGIMLEIAHIACSLLVYDYDFFFFVQLWIVTMVCLYRKFLPMLMCGVVVFAATVVMLALNPYALIGNLADTSSVYVRFEITTQVAVAFIFLCRGVEKRESESEKAAYTFKAVFENTPNMAVIINTKNEIQYVSDQLLGTSGKKRENTINKVITDAFGTGHFHEIFADVIEHKEFYEYTHEAKINERAYHFRIVSNPLIKPLGQLIVIIDITPIEEARLKAEEAQRVSDFANESKSRFLAMMSHEIRTPINVILGSAEVGLINNLTYKREDNRALLARMQTAAYSLLGIINDILDISKIESGKLTLNPAKYELPSFINDTIQLNTMRISSKPIEFVLKTDDDLPMFLFGDELRLKQILNNLISNAIKYTESGCITFSVSCEITDTADTAVAYGKDVLLTFSIQDTGQGMKPEDLEKLFNEYTRFNTEANRKIEGTGLGMNIARTLINMMGGTIDVKSVFGEGSEFIVAVRQGYVSDERMDSVTAENLKKFVHISDKGISKLQITRTFMPYGRVLVVDDTESNLLVAEGLLSPYGLQIETAKSGFDCIEKIKANSANNKSVYDVIFMDHMMPVMDGIETTAVLRKNGYKGTIIALTANAVLGYDQIFIENGFDDFLSKPIDIRLLNTQLNKYVRNKHPEEAESAATEEVVIEASDDTGIEIPNVDIKRGIMLSGGDIDKYCKLLRVFCRDSDKRISTFAALPTADTVDDFKISVHGLKSIAGTIGALNLQKAAAELEKAAREHNYNFISCNLPGLYQELCRLSADITITLDKREKESEPRLTLDETNDMKNALNELKTALKEKNPVTADEVLTWITEQKLPRKTKDIIDEISDCVLMAELDKAAKLLQKVRI